MHYRIVPPTDAAASSVVSATLASFRSDKQMQADLAKLDRACCAPQKLVVPEGAPRPSILAASQ
jgi:ArsR family transcriptional regulator